jgi:hypothetical protein
MPRPSEVLVFIDNDGSARELTDAEKTYVDSDFSPFDGARPYIKSRYEQRNALGELRGFLQRRQLTAGTAVHPAPPPSPPVNRPQAVADSILDVIRKHRPE